MTTLLPFPALICALFVFIAVVSASAQNIGVTYGSRNPRTCPNTKAPTSGPISAQQAMQYVICGYEKEFEGGTTSLFLVDNIKLEIGGGRPFQPGTDGMTDADVRSPIYPIRGSYNTYQIAKLYTGPELSWRNAGKNCNTYLNRPFTGKCYRTTYGDWSCLTTAGGSAYPDIANTTPPVR